MKLHRRLLFPPRNPARFGTSLAFAFAFFAFALAAKNAPPMKKVAAIVTEYRHNSHADVIVSRLLQTHTLDDKGARPNLALASLYLDQVPENDTGRKWAKKYGVPIFPTIRDALTLGGDTLAVDGVLLIAEHGDYPKNDLGVIFYPKRRFFEETEKVFRASGRSVPVFVDKHLAHDWANAKRAYDVSRELGFPLLAGSSLPVTWRRPAADLRRGAPLKEILVTTYGAQVGYGFHALEILQCLAEGRQGGETGARRVRFLSGAKVWEAGRAGLFDPALLEAACARGEHRSSQFGERPVEQLVRNPYLFHVEYRDGLKANVINTENAVWQWCAAWREKGADEEASIPSTLFRTQENRPYGHFSFLLQGIERTVNEGRSAWPPERTLLTTGLLDALLRSKARGGAYVDTPHLNVSYQSTWKWKPPPPPPPSRPFNQQ